jgi:hypothetical protein
MPFSNMPFSNVPFFNMWSTNSATGILLENIVTTS